MSLDKTFKRQTINRRLNMRGTTVNSQDFMIAFAILVVTLIPRTSNSANEGLIGYWKIAGDCRDHSSNGLDAVNHNVDLGTSDFNGLDAYLEIPNSPKLR